jgi:signal peptidase I
MEQKESCPHRNGMKNCYKVPILIVVALIIGVQAFAKPFRVSGDCMEPAIMDGQLCFMNRISPYLRPHQIGNTIAFKHEGKDWVSRVVALETDTIQLVDGSVVVNGIPLQNAGIHRSWSNWRYGAYAIDNQLQVPPGHVFVLSDNLSAQHDDSRVFGPISNESIFGLVW